MTSREADGDSVDLIHDVLVREWELLKSWVREDKLFLKWRQESEQRALAWAETGEDPEHRDAGRLIPDGHDLAVARDFLGARGAELSIVEREFIQTSVATREQERKRLQELLEETKHQRDEALRQRELALARQLAAEAEMLSGQQTHELQKAVLLALESIKRAPSVQADHVLRQGFALLPRLQAGFWRTVSGGTVRTDPDGAYLRTASLGPNNQLTLSGEFEFNPTGKPENGVSLAYHPNGKSLAITTGTKDLEFLALDDQAQNSKIEMPQACSGVVWSLTGRCLAVKSLGERKQPGAAYVWANQKWLQLQHEDQVRHVLFTRDERFVITSGDDQTVRIWDGQNGQELKRFTLAEFSAASEIAVSADGTLLALVDKAALIPNLVRLLRLPGGEEIIAVPEESGAHLLAFSPDGNLLAIAGGGVATDGVISVWDLRSRTRCAQMKHDMRVNAMTFSPDGSRLATASSDRTARIWRMPTGGLETSIQHEQTLWGIAYSPDGKLLATAGQACLARVWDAQSYQEVSRMVLDDNSSTVQDFCFSPDGNSLALASSSGAFWLYERAPRATAIRLAHDGPVTKLEIFPNGYHVATVASGSLHFWAGPSGEHLAQAPGSLIAFSAGGRYGAQFPAPDSQKAVYIWDLTTKAGVASIPLENTATDLVLSPDGARLAVVDLQGKLSAWNLAAPDKQLPIPANGFVFAIAFDAASGALMTASGESANILYSTCIQVWDETGKEVNRQSAKLIAKALAVSLDGKLVAIGGYGGVQLWAADRLGVNGARPLAYLPVASTVNALAWSSDGRYLAIAGSDKLARIWDSTALQEISRLTHLDIVRDVSFSPDGKYLATASDDGSGVLWLWQSQDLLVEAQMRLTRNLTPSEWQNEMGKDIDFQPTQPKLPPGKDSSLLPDQVVIPLIGFGASQAKRAH